MSGWVFVPISSATAIIDGGTGGFIVMFIINWIGFFLIVLSLAEMSSIAPTAGGQYHWTSEFAPASWQRFISYMAGWLSSLSWLCGVTSGMFTGGTLIQGVVVLTHPNYSPQPYQGWLLVVCIAAMAVLFNTYLAKHLPKLEGIVLVVFVVAFAAVLIVLWVLSPKLSASDVFSTFTNDGGWSSLGLSMVAGQSVSVYLLIGSDSSAHMAEETQGASIVIPRTMCTAYILNGAMGLVMVITFCFCLTDLATASESATGYMFMQVFTDATGSIKGGTALTCILIVLLLCSAVNYMASTSRQVFAFARDKGLPFHQWISKVRIPPPPPPFLDSQQLTILQVTNSSSPLNAVFVTFLFVILLSLISLGSSIAFNAIISLQLLAVVSTYMVSVGCIIWRRYYGKPLPASVWTLGRYGGAINIAAFAYCTYLIIFIPFPVTTPVTAASFNWAPVMFVGVMAIALAYYFVTARKTYEGPVTLVVDDFDM